MEITKKYNGHTLKVVRVDAPGVGYWYDGYLNEEKAVFGGGKGYTPNDVFALLENLVDIE